MSYIMSTHTGTTPQPDITASSKLECQPKHQFTDPLDSRKVTIDLFELYCVKMLSTNNVDKRTFLRDELSVSRLPSFLSHHCIIYLQTYPKQNTI